jgi:hypothetical protein
MSPLRKVAEEGAGGVPAEALTLTKIIRVMTSFYVRCRTTRPMTGLELKCAVASLVVANSDGVGNLR